MNSPLNPPRPLLLGHRGARASRSIPENTLASFDLALQQGCDGFEFDARLTADGCAIICHDPIFAGLEIATANAAQLPQLPLLDDVLARYGSRAFLNIELKVPGLENLLTAALSAHDLSGGCFVSSFLPQVLVTLRRLAPALKLGFLCDTEASLNAWREWPVQYVIPHHSLLSRELIAEVHAAGLQCITWTVNAASQMRSFGTWGVDGIISDDPALLVSTLHPLPRQRELPPRLG